jgi:hypothetical protein
MTGDFEARMHMEEDGEVRAALRALPRQAPPGLTTSLRVIASRERQRRLAAQRGWWSRLIDFSDWVSLRASNLMGPLVVPIAGGVFSAVILIGSMLTIIPVHASTEAGFDIPTMLTTEAGIKGTEDPTVYAKFFCPWSDAGPICTGDDGDVVVVDISLDGQGRMVDYAIVSGAAVLHNAALRRRLENILLFTEFVPATAFGQPTTSKLRLPLLSSSLKAKG